MQFILAHVVAAMFVIQTTPPPAPQSPFDIPTGRLNPSKSGRVTVIERLSINQLMRIAALPQARIIEMQCAGTLQWDQVQSWPAFTLPEAERKTVVAQVAAALANDAELKPEDAAEFVALYASEGEERREAGELASFRKKMESNCAGMIADARAGKFKPIPMIDRSVVDPMMATCYVRYILGAEAAKDEEEAASLRKTAERAEMIALDGKSGDALAAAKAALTKQLEMARSDSRKQLGDEMANMVVCLPAMAGAEKALGK